MLYPNDVKMQKSCQWHAPQGELPYPTAFVNDFWFRTTRSSNRCRACEPSHSRWT